MMITKTKFPAQKISLCAVYHKVMVFGSIGRIFCVAYPSKSDAVKWIEDHKKPWNKDDDFMIEEFVGTMKSWEPYKK